MNKTNKNLIDAYVRGYRVDHGGGVIGLRGGKITLIENSNGYLNFSIRNSLGKRCVVLVHRLQAYQKYGRDIFDSNIQVRHVSGDKKDNSWGNICTGTCSENRMDIDKKKRIEFAQHAGRENSTLKKEDVLEIREQVKEGNYETYQKLAERYGLSSKGTISGIVNKRTWKNI